MFRLKKLNLVTSLQELSSISSGKKLINTINAFSYNNARKDKSFAEALTNGDYLVPDGESIVMACKWLNAKSKPSERIAGWDLFILEMDKLNQTLGKCMFMGSSEKVLALIKEQAAKQYPNIEIVTYSPPYKKEFSDEDNQAIIDAINGNKPDLLWIGMTAPKKEKWVYEHWDKLNIECHVGTIGAVFDFFAGTAKRAPEWFQRHCLEWLYRLIIEPRRMWRRYLIGNTKFLWYMLQERFSKI